ncbi:MAG: glycosyltransferase family 4 protein [Anaerolineae bacterium]|nr:glycosyltransferase family 4 protein [Anaerolineae bacterium]
MQIVFLTQYYPPETGAPQRRLSELAERLTAAGHEVTVLTAMPNYPRGAIFEGYGRVLSREKLGGANVIRTFIYPTQKAALLPRMWNYFSFVLSSLIVGTFLLPRGGVLLVESPPLFLGFSALWLSLFKGSRLIFNVSDLWPESAVRLGIIREGSLPHRLSAWLERLCYRRAWLISGQSRSILSDIQSRFPEKETFLLSNGVDTQKFQPGLRDEAIRARLTGGRPDAFVALYAGLHGLAQGLEQVVEAAALLRDHPAAFVLVGDGPEKAQLMESARAQRLTNLAFQESIPAEAVPAWLASADVVLVTLKMFIPGAVPSKIYEALATGLPVILVASGEPADILNRAQAGIVVEPGDVAGLARAVESLQANPALCRQYGENGRRAALEHYNRDKIAGAFIARLEKG